jgi:hypothetical protein
MDQNLGAYPSRDRGSLGSCFGPRTTQEVDVPVAGVDGRNIEVFTEISDTPIGLGMAGPRCGQGMSRYFHHGLRIVVTPIEVPVQDSVVFRSDQLRELRAVWLGQQQRSLCEDFWCWPSGRLFSIDAVPVLAFQLD